MSPAIVQALREHTGKVCCHAESLQRGYAPHDLHQFRVNTRRIRSLLKRMRGGPADFFRHSWGAVFRVSNRARDLDVLQLAAGGLLPADQHGLFAPLLAPLLRESHETVLSLLDSGKWRRHLAGWRGYLLKIERRPPEVVGDQVRTVLERAREARRTALDRGLDLDWHKFRIAVKNVRYVADASRNEPAADAAYLDALIEDCMVLQTLLGDWHDTIVQLRIIEEDWFSGLLPVTPGLAAVKTRLGQEIQSRKSGLLAQTRQALDRHDPFVSD